MLVLSGHRGRWTAGIAWLALTGCAPTVATPNAVPSATTAPLPQTTDTRGYGLTLVNVTPANGTRLAPGKAVIFSVTVAYHLEVADTGMIVLVPQDERGSSILRWRAQRALPVGRGTGQVTLTDSLTVPEGIRGVHLFIVLAPAGYETTEGEVVLRYPVRGKPGAGAGDAAGRRS